MELHNLSGPVGPYHQASDPLTVLLTAQDNQDHRALLALLVTMHDEPEVFRRVLNELVLALNAKQRFTSGLCARLSVVR